MCAKVRNHPVLVLPCLALILLCRAVGHMANANQLHVSEQLISSVQTSTDQFPSSSVVNADPPDRSKEDEDLSEELQHSLRFDPPQVDFGIQSVGTAQSHTVTLVNQHTNRSAYLSSVSGSTPSFYSSFFEAKVIPPLGNTTFNIVFLPREEGALSTDILIHTSFGLTQLVVRGEGRECPYRLKPIVGIKAPLNATLTPEIHMYNPHERPLQILEVYSSGGQFQLELPSGGQEGPQDLWEIPAHSIKPIIRIRFHGRTAGNHTAYIRIKISEQLYEGTDSPSENVLVVPVEFEILPQPGLYATNPIVDFGRLTTISNEPLKLKLDMQNSFESCFHILAGFKMPDIPGLTFDQKDATVTLNTQLLPAVATLDELLILQSASKRNSSEVQEFSVNVRAEVFKGSLRYNRNVTVFVTKAKHYVSGEMRTLLIFNEFETPVTLLNITVDHNDTSVVDIRLAKSVDGENFILAPGQSAELLHIRAVGEEANFRTLIRIHTNITDIRIPVIVCTGLLEVTTLETGLLRTNFDYNLELDLGVIPLSEMSHEGYIILHNGNPIPIKLTNWDFQSPQGVYFHTTFLGCLRKSVLKMAKNDSIRFESTKLAFCSFLDEGDYAAFQVAVQSYNTEHNMGKLKIWTSHETITTTVKFQIWSGKLEVDQEKIYFKSCFPGKLCSSDLSIRSTFKQPIHITNLNFSDGSLRFEGFNPDGSVLAPSAVTRVGRISFEPSTLCENRCYIQNDERSSAIAFPALQDTKGGQNNNFHFDETELRRRTELYRHLKWYFQKISFTLNSLEVHQFLLQLIIDIEWPKLGRIMHAQPVVEVGKHDYIMVEISNPADSPILVDYFLADPQFAKETQLSLPLEVVDLSAQCYLTDKPVFQIVEPPTKSPITIPPQSSIVVKVAFEAKEMNLFCTLLHIRNNLTLYEAIWLSAKAVQTQFRFGNRKPGSSTPLLFEVSEKHLATCTQKSLDRDKLKYPLVVTKRTFTARNTGELPIWIDTFLIGEQQCEGYGFKVINCTGFELRANESRKVDIAFSPDFTLSRISRPLTLKTNLSYDVNYMLLAHLPHVSVDQCAELLPRPYWEQSIRNTVMALLAATFIFVLIAAHIDYGNILFNQSLMHMSRDKGPIHPTFNLRNIATKSQPPAKETVVVPPKQKPPAQQKSVSLNSYSGENNIKRRTVRKSSGAQQGSTTSHSNRNVSLPDIAWPLSMSASKSAPTLSDRSFKAPTLPEPEKPVPIVATPTPTPTPPPTPELIPTPTVIPTKSSPPGVKHSPSNDSTNSIASSTSKKQQQRSSKKSKHNTSTSIANVTVLEKPEKEADPPMVTPTKATSKKVVEKIPELEVPIAKPIIESKKLQVDKSTTPPPSLSSQASSSTSASSSSVTTTPTPIAASTIESGTGNLQNVAVQTSLLKESSTSRKHGKTPGRERRKEVQHSSSDAGGSTASSTCSSSSCSSSSSSANRMTNNKKSERKSKKAVSALNFNLSPTLDDGNTNAKNDTPLNCITSPWETGSQVSFSDVLQLPNVTASMPTESKRNPITNNILYEIDLKSNQNFIGLSSSPLITPPLKKPIKEKISFNNITSNTNTTTELGPIGSKKSPSSTPIWETISNNKPAAAIVPPPTSSLALPKPMITSNSSFFSNIMPTVYDNGPQIIGGVSSTLLELKKKQEELQLQWQTNEYILNLHQQQLRAQQQQQQQQQQQLHHQSHSHQQQQQQLLHNVNVNATSNNWGMNNLPAWTPMGYGQSMNNERISTPSPSLGLWQTNNNLMRPPPGLESNVLGNVMSSQQQQQQHVPVVNDPIATSQADSHIPAFDPFSSLSSIWSDNWNRTNNNNNQNNNNNNRNNLN